MSLFADVSFALRTRRVIDSIVTDSAKDFAIVGMRANRLASRLTTMLSSIRASVSKSSVSWGTVGTDFECLAMDSLYWRD